jgi:hypothetical protein
MNKFLHSEVNQLIQHIITEITSRRSRWAGHVTRPEEGRNAFKLLMGKSIGRRHLGGARHIWEDNISMNRKEMGIKTRNWVYSVQDMD